MLKEIHKFKKPMSTPYEYYEHLSIRFNVKETEQVNKYLLLYKIDKNKSFSEGHKLCDMLMNAFMEIQTLPKINNKDDKRILNYTSVTGQSYHVIIWVSLGNCSKLGG